mmetsp:Transcript_1601/g.2126  ORF Transcript_1601/g.2126 Transcript_1601/m.2126 type:complete len:95 (+) Transcript_1601:394-678(+)
MCHLDVVCWVWPAFWLTDEDKWPENGEIDIVEGVNNQSVAKTALHTSKDCEMFAQVPDYEKTGLCEWFNWFTRHLYRNPRLASMVQSRLCPCVI